MLIIRYYNNWVASILFIVFSITLSPGCTYKFYSWGYEQDKIQTLESGDKVSVRMKNGDSYKLKIIDVGQFALRGTDKEEQMVVVPLSEMDMCFKIKVDRNKSRISILKYCGGWTRGGGGEAYFCNNNLGFGSFL